MDGIVFEIGYTRAPSSLLGQMGYYRMHRDWMGCAIFSCDPFDRRSAWVWLIEP